MAQALLISVDEYLRTSYRPDREYLNGEVAERNVGERNHSRIQGFLDRFLGNREADWDIVVLPEQRIQVTEDRFRVPDLCVLRRDDPDEQIVRTPPLICIEVLSSEDSLSSLQERIDDYVNMGVANIWVIDPRTRRGYAANRQGLAVVEGELVVEGTAIRVPLQDLFKELRP